jgi:pimeloyl-ACP methyl ester carboxylesterase
VFITFLLAFFMACVPAQADTFWQKLAWTTPDGVQMVGVYHPASRPSAYVWILLHGLGSSKEEWELFSRKLSQQGNGAFLYDARGHHESNHTSSGETISYQAWHSAGPGTPWDAMPADLASAVALLRKQFGIPEEHIAVGGASLGANVALVYANAHPAVPALVLLSSGGEYAGVNIEKAWHEFHARPVFAAASPDDRYAYQTLRFLAQQRPDLPVRIAEGSGAEHGVNMFKDPIFTKKLLRWMKEIN